MFPKRLRKISITIHQRNFQVLASENLKVKNDLSPEIINQVFELKEAPCSLRSQGNCFARGNVKTTQHSIQSIKYLAPIYGTLFLVK